MAKKTYQRGTKKQNECYRKGEKQHNSAYKKQQNSKILCRFAFFFRRKMRRVIIWRWDIGLIIVHNYYSSSCSFFSRILRSANCSVVGSAFSSKCLITSTLFLRFQRFLRISNAAPTNIVVSSCGFSLILTPHAPIDGNRAANKENYP